MDCNTLSIIIPCKDRSENTKLILNELCRQKQSFPQTEIIVVENGSTEDMSFLETYDITLVREEQKSVGYARNVGLDIAAGDYITFIDNDDMIFENYLPVIYEHIKLGYDWYAWQWYSDYTPIYMNDFDVRNPMKSNWALWGYCYSKKIFEGFRFDEDKKVGGDLKIIEVMNRDWNGYFIKELMYRFKWEGNEDSLSHLHNRGLLT